jgi:hypothetical protein
VTEAAPPVAELLNLDGRVALVTGSGGIGVGDAQRLQPGYKTARCASVLSPERTFDLSGTRFDPLTCSEASAQARRRRGRRGVRWLLARLVT